MDSPKVVKMTQFVPLQESTPAFLYNGMMIEEYSYLIIPLCEKGTILDLLLHAIPKGVEVSVELQGYLSRQIIDALDFLHNLNKLGHLDLKPDNLVITKDYKVALIDFAHANHVKAEVSLRTGTP